MKGIDITFVHYGIRKEDMQIIDSVCNDYQIDEYWLKENILKKYHEGKTNDIEFSEKSVRKIIDKAVQKL